MAFETIGDVLEHAKQFHRKLAELYGQLGDTARKDKIRILLTYMQRHEENMVDVLHSLEEDTSQRILKTWFKYPPEFPRHKCFECVTLLPEMTAEEIVDAALRVDECLRRLYRHGLEKAITPETKDFFGKLLDMEKQKETEVLRNALTFDQQE
jgi:hypothetical protein